MASAPPHESDQIENLGSSTSTIPTLHPDIINTHILTRLDGATLAAASSVSSQLRHLCSGEDLWHNVCITTWPSLIDPITSHVISTFPGGYRSFFSDAFPSLHHDNHNPHRVYPPPPLQELISALDIYYKGKPLFSRVQRFESQNNRSLKFQLCVDVLPPKELVPIPVLKVSVAWLLKYLEENLRLSWIVIDPTRKRAANVSSWKPVTVQWDSCDLEVVYAVVMAGEQNCARVKVNVACILDWSVDECRLYLKRVKMEMEDMDGWPMTWSRWREGVMILQSAIENGKRKKVDEVGAKERFEKFSSRIKERRVMGCRNCRIDNI